ncbi:DUF2169 domain-containing protein [Pseudomonas sp. EL_65y_Pfl1_R83]|uniref:DUF2169 domain-containing protein n=1 Tax=Pseudomonas sp. EL_65y_Pfl1_R83 TaxID=3088697 RepID=UPI0030DADF74
MWCLDRANHHDGELDANGIAQNAACYKNQPPGFGVVSRAWAPRLPLAAAYDETWTRERSPGLPPDADYPTHSDEYKNAQTKTPTISDRRFR